MDVTQNQSFPSAQKEAGFRASTNIFPRSAAARWFMVAILSGVAWRLIRYFLNFELTIDESYIMNNVIPRSYRELLNPLDYAQVSPPAFLWITKLFDSLFGNEWGVRLIPFLAGLTGIIVFWGVCLEVLRGAARWVACAIFTVSYVPVEQSTCAKGYTIDLLVALLMFWLMLRWLRGGHRARELFWLVLCAPIFVWFSYTSVFVIGGISLVFLAYLIRQPEGRRWQNIAAGFAFMALAGGSAIWLYVANIRPSIQASHASGLQDFWAKGYPPLQHPAQIPLWLLQVHTGRGFAWPVGDNNFGSTLTTVLWLTGLIIYWRRGNRWVWMLLVTPQLLSLIASFLHKYPYGANPRICMFLGPGICLFMGAGVQYLLGRLGHAQRRASYRIAAVILVIIAVGGIARDVALKIRELRTPGIRTTLRNAAQLVGTDGQFVVLTPTKNLTEYNETSQVLSYYLRRYVTQPVSWNGELSPAQVRPGCNVAVMAVATKTGEANSAAFDRFEKRFGQSIKQTWTQEASIHTKTPDRLITRIYHIGAMP